MPKLFGKDIAKLVAQKMGSGLLPATLISRAPGSRTSGSLTSGTNPDEATASARGIIDDYAAGLVDGSLIQKDDRRVLLLAETISGGAIPKPNDSVTIEDVTYRVIRVQRDPAAATYTLQVRK